MGAILYKIARPIPVLGSIVFLASHKHECGVNPDEPNAILRQQFFRSSRTGMWVHYRVWNPAGAPRAQITLLHGYAEHCGRYEHVGAALAAAGYRVVALDHQGSGRSEGDKGFVERFRHFVDDVLQLAREVAPAPQGLPHFLFGHSMGGLIAIHTAHAAPADLFSGLILSGPGLVFDPKVDTPLNRAMATLLSSILPKLPVQKLDVNTLCTDPTAVRNYTRDPLVYHGPLRVRFGKEMMAAVAQVHEWAGSITLPLLIVHGEADVLCNPAGSTWLMGAVGSADKSLKMYAGMKHEIMNEPAVSATVVADVADWIAKRL